MCGRFYLDAKTDELLAFFGLSSIPHLPTRYNIAPSQSILAITNSTEGLHAGVYRWGLLPFWAKQDKSTFHTINARIETVESKPAFRTPFRSRRCLIPASGYYEWQKQPSAKQPYCIRPDNGPLMAFAGLYDRWTDPQGGSVDSCTIIVADASTSLRPIHERMPVILQPEYFKAWLDRDQHDVSNLKALLAQRLTEGFETFPVSTHVNNPRNDDPRCIEPLSTLL
ncbi:MAG: SOS response-associated peptidase [Candidatus Thiodiazotropha sp.]